MTARTQPTARTDDPDPPGRTTPPQLSGAGLVWVSTLIYPVGVVCFVATNRSSVARS